jgi:hypothetical protein
MQGVSMDDFIEIVRRNRGVLSEVERIDAAMREGMDIARRRTTPPWTMMGRGRFEAEEFAIWRDLDAAALSADAAVAKFRALIERYYATSATGGST